LNDDATATASRPTARAEAVQWQTGQEDTTTNAVAFMQAASLGRNRAALSNNNNVAAAIAYTSSASRLDTFWSLVASRRESMRPSLWAALSVASLPSVRPPDVRQSRASHFIEIGNP